MAVQARMRAATSTRRGTRNGWRGSSSSCKDGQSGRSLGGSGGETLRAPRDLLMSPRLPRDPGDLTKPGQNARGEAHPRAEKANWQRGCGIHESGYENAKDPRV